MTKSHALITCCKTASLGQWDTINWDNTWLVLSSVPPDNKHSTNVITHSMSPLVQIICAVLVRIMWPVRSLFEGKYAFINYLDVFSKLLNLKGGKRHSIFWSRKKLVSFSLKCPRQSVITVWCGLCHETSWCVDTILWHLGWKKHILWSREKGDTHLSTELWLIFPCSYNPDCFPAA